MRIFLHHISARLIHIILVIFISNMIVAQEPETCAEKLQTAQMLFEKGQVDQVPEMIKDCLKSGFNREESLQAYKLIIQSYLFDEQLDLADSAMLAFLRKNPEYEVSPTDHTSFVSLFNNFISKVIIQFSMHGGANIPFTSTISSGPVLGIPGERTFSRSATNFCVSAEAKYKITRKIELNAEVGYSQFSFMHTEPVSNGIYGYAESNYEETQRRIEIPLTATYDAFRFGRFTPYARLGFGPAFNVGSSAIGEFSPNDLRAAPRTGASEKNLPRIFMDVFIQAGAGIKLKVREGFVLAEVRSNLGLFGQSTFQGYISDKDDKHFFFNSGEPNFRLNTLNITLGYTWIFYKPARKEE